MSITLADRVKVRTRTQGLGSFLLENTVTGFRGFSAIGDGNETYYVTEDTAGNWELGRGTYNSISSTLSRDSILSSSNNGQKVDFPAGSKNISVTFPAELASTLAYEISAETVAGGAALRFFDTVGNNDDVNFLGGSGVVVTRTDNSNISITTDISQSVELSGSDVVLRLARAGAANDDITVTGTNGTTITRTDANTINIDTNIAQGVAVVFGM